MSGQRVEPGWKISIRKQMEERRKKEMDPFMNLYAAYTSSLYRSLAPITGYKEQGDRLSKLQSEFANSKKELAEAYETSAKHARALFEYIESTKEAEKNLHLAHLRLDQSLNEKENLITQAAMTKAGLKAKEEAFNTLSHEYRSLEKLYKVLEGKVIKQSKELYASNEAQGQLKRQQEAMETQILTSAKLIGDLTEEIAALHSKERIKKLGDTNQSSSGPIQRRPNMLNGGDSGLGCFETPPIAKHRYVDAHTESINQIVYNLANNTLASCSNDNTVKTWSALSGSNTKTFTGSTRSVRCVEFSPDNYTIAAGSSDNGIYQWEQKTGKLKQKLLGHRDKVTAIKFRDNSTMISASHDRKVQIWDLNRGSIVSTLHSCGSRVNDICTTASNSIITANFDKSIRLFDARSLELISRAEVHTDIITSVCCSQDYSWILTCARDGSIQLTNSHSLEPIQTYRHPEFSNRSEMNRAFFSGTEKYVISAGSTKVFVWDRKTGELVNSTPRTSNSSFMCIGVASSGSQMACGAQDGGIVLWDQ